MPDNHFQAVGEPRLPLAEQPKAATAIKDRLTIVTTYYQIPSAPRMTVLRKTIEGLRKNLDVAGCRHLVYYHDPADGTPRTRQHLENLRKLCDHYGLELYVRPDSGIKVNLIEAIGEVKTPYMLFLEYDLEYRRKIDIAKLLGVFDKYNYVNYVHFNTFMNNSLYQWGHLVQTEDRIPEVPLTRTSCWSNQAHVVRMSKWHDEWLDIIGTDKPAKPVLGLENRMYWDYNRDIFTIGFDEAVDKWGVYYYGEIDDGRTVRHNDGALNSGTVLEYLNKASRRLSKAVRKFGR